MSIHRLLVRHLGRDLELTSTDPDATVADLVTALDPGTPPGPLWVDGRAVRPATPLDRAGIHHGAEVRTSPPPTGPTRPAVGPGTGAPGTGGPGTGRPAVRLRVTTGAANGVTVDLAPGHHLLGRRPPPPGAVVPDPTVSVVHARLDVAGGPSPSVTVTDLGSTNGTRTGGRPVGRGDGLRPGDDVTLGGARIVVEATSRPDPVGGPPDEHRTPDADGRATTPRHRSGRTDVAPDPAVVALPEPPAPPVAVVPVGLVALGASAGGAVVMVLVLGSWRYAAFALLGPVTMIAHALDARRRRRRGRRRHRRRLRRDLARLEREITTAADAERRRRAVRFADPFGPTVSLDPAAPTCWERRPHHDDALAVRVGHGRGPWRPTVAGSVDDADPEVTALLDRHHILEDTAIGLRLEPGRPVAVVGPPELARGLARTVVLAAATAHGPADLAVAALWADPGGAWDWLAWLPHSVDADGASLLGADAHGAEALAERLAGPTAAVTSPGRTAGPVTLVVIDDPGALRDRRGPARTVLHRGGQDPSLIALVVLPTGAPVPAVCGAVLRIDADGGLHGPPTVTAGPAVVAATPASVAAAHARALARFDDPETNRRGRHLPTEVRLRGLLGLAHATPAAVRARWRAGGVDPAPTATIGSTADGPLRLDLATDGPHVLVAGTTGAGKSELLRSLILALAATNSPDHLAFVLVDFKGGSAFDACARLPHTAGLVTDLDDHLAARALRCLEAELRERERRLRAVGASDLAGLRRLAPDGPPLPRLVVVVDEFAALRVAVPDFVDALVDVAQRGRSLGVHLILATQRPSGAVSPAIQANVGLRICLRVQSTQDSVDVIASAEGADLPRRVPGRALVRLGPGELLTAQVAIAGAPELDGGGVQVRPLGAPRRPVTANGRVGPQGSRGSDRSDLEAMVDVVAEAWTQAGGAPPRCPWPDPLPDQVPWPLTGGPDPTTDPEHLDPDPLRPGRRPPGDQVDQVDHLVLGLADDPDHQRQVPFTWDLARGPILALGLPGAGAATLAATAVLEAVRAWPEPPVVHVVDGGPGELGALAGLASVGAVVTAHDHERQRRLLDTLAGELTARRTDRARCGARRLVVVHGLGTLRAHWEDRGDAASPAHLLALLTGGAACGIHLCLTSEGPVPHPVLAACEQRVLFRLGDPGEVAAHGIPARAVPPLPPDRAVTPVGGSVTVVHVARPVDGLAAAVAVLAARRPEVGHPGDEPTAQPVAPPEWIGVLPRVLTHRDLVDHLGDLARSHTSEPGPHPVADGGRALLVGLADRHLGPARLHLPPGGHALVSGPPRSGRTTTLARLAAEAASTGSVVWVAVQGSTPPPLPPAVSVLGVDDAALADALHRPGPLLILVDDADRTDDDHPVLAAVATDRRPDRHVVAAGRNDRLRRRFGHWVREVRADGTGLLLVPDLDLDGDLVGTRLPRRPLLDLVCGRGWLTGPGGGPSDFVQVALPPPPDPPADAPPDAPPDATATLTPAP